jgi:PhzF family phenazine biosynthesis protein
MSMKFWIVGTFGDRPFGGAPASVFFVDNFDDKVLMRNIAMEVNTQETVFVKQIGDCDFVMETYCPSISGMFFGNGLFAASKVVRELNLTESKDLKLLVNEKIFHSSIKGDVVTVELESEEINKIPPPIELSHSMDGELFVSVAEAGRSLVVELRSPSKIQSLSANTNLFLHIQHEIIIATADCHYEKNTTYDVCTRIFAPKLGLIETFASPLSYANLASYWSNRLQKNELVCLQCSRRPVYSSLNYSSGKVLVSGRCIDTISGTMNI